MTKFEYKHTLKISSIMATRLLGLFILFPVFSLYAVQYSASPIMIGLILGIYGLVQATLQIPFGYLSDKYGRKPLLIVGLILFFIGSVIAAIADDAIGLLVGRILQGSGAISAVLMATLADGISPENRIKANTILGMQIGASFIISLLIAPIISHYFALSGLFWLSAILALIALGIVATFQSVQKPPLMTWSINHLKLVLTPTLLRLDMGIYLLHCLLSANFILLPLLLSKQLPLVDNWQFYLPVMLGSFVLMLPFIIVSHKYKKTNFVMNISILMLGITQFLLYYFSSNFIYLTALMMVFFAFFNVIEASLPSLIANSAPIKNKGLAMGIFSTSQFLGVFSGGLIGGLVYQYFGREYIFIFGAIIIIFWLLLYKK